MSGKKVKRREVEGRVEDQLKELLADCLEDGLIERLKELEDGVLERASVIVEERFEARAKERFPISDFEAWAKSEQID